MEGRLILALLVCLALTEYGLGSEIVTRELKCRRIVCTMDYRPVCGSDGKTYSNECQLIVADCKSEEDITKVRDGRCVIGLLRELGCGRIVCTMDYAPVCGSDGTTYGNECELIVANCKSKEDITKVHNGPCNCGKPCVRIYAPVCGSDGKTYPNECELENADCLTEEDITKFHDGPCGCGRIHCTMDYTPVCGSDCKTYSNQCQLTVANCKSKQDIWKVRDGPCSR